MKSVQPRNGDDKLSEQALLKAYEVAVAEYRFNVQLGWERTRFLLTFDAALISAGVGILTQASDSFLIRCFLVILFLVALLIGLLALEIVTKSKKHYRRSLISKTNAELALGFLDGPNSLALAATTTQQKLINEIASGEEGVSADETNISPRSIVGLLRWIFIVLNLTAVIGIVLATVQAAISLTPLEVP